MSEFRERLAAAKAGDEAAFVLLFRAVQPTLLRYLTTLGGSLAEDAAAETWVSVVRSLPTFTGDEAGWRAWVFTIGHARLRDAQRRAVRDPLPLDTAARLADRPDEDDVPGRVEELMSTEAALALVARLPRTEAAAVLLRHVAGFDVPTTARVLGKKPGTVRVAAHRGLARLAEMLEQDPKPDVTGSGSPTVTEMRW
jgi:RNA polymerase sigma-70 factor (ECF subfamily)